MVILGGLGNVAGAVVGAVALIGLPETFPRHRRLPHADLRPGAAAADPLPAAGPAGDGMRRRVCSRCRRGAPLRRRDRGQPVDLTVAAGELCRVIGPNGAGKTTLFNLITGHDAPDCRPHCVRRPRITGIPPERIAALGLARTFQHGRVFANLSVRDNVLIGAHTRLDAVRRSPPVSARWWSCCSLWCGRRGAARQQAAPRRRATFSASSASGCAAPRRSGVQPVLRQSPPVEIARALALHPRLLLLDEPTAGMNQTETAEMLDIIRTEAARACRPADRAQARSGDALSDRVIVMDDGVKIAEGRRRWCERPGGGRGLSWPQRRGRGGASSPDPRGWGT